MVDPDILLIAMVESIEGVKNLIGEKGASAVLRDAGRHSGPKLLESMIGSLPETYDLEKAVATACSMLEELGFAKKAVVSESKVVVEGDIFSDAVRTEIDRESPIVSFIAGILEGFVQFMSNDKVVMKPESVEKGKMVFSYS